MKSLQMSVGNIFLYSLFVLLLASCTSRKGETNRSGSSTASLSSSEEVSIKGDNEELEELRKSIPKNIRDRNDALKETLSLMGELRLHPQKIRNKFDKLQRKRRHRFQKNYRKIRDNFTKTERKNRKVFLDNIKKKRDNSKSKEMTREQRNDFYNELDAERKEYFSEQKDKRKNFESDIKEKQKDFYYELKEQRKEFSEEWRNYNNRWRYWQKKNKKTRNSKARGRNNSNNGLSPQDRQDFQQLNSSQGQNLSADDN